MALKATLASKALRDLRVPKTELEIATMRGFLYRLGLNRYWLDKRECPDFLLTLQTDEPLSFACELTAFHSDSDGPHGSSDRRFAQLWLAFAERLRTRLKIEMLDHWYGAIHFKRPIRDKLPSIPDFVDEIVAVLRRADGSTIDSFDLVNTTILYEHVNHIFLRNTLPETGILWWCAHLQVGVVGSSEAALRHVVSQKDRKARLYAWPECREKWLVIYAGSLGLADKIFLPHRPEPPISSAEFSRVFLWDKFSESIHQLFPGFATLAEMPRIYRRSLPDFLQNAVLRES